jgi:hypothetical protein
MTDQEIFVRASRFWRLAVHVEPFPRLLERAIAWALPLTIVKLPRLSFSDLRIWLAQRGISFMFSHSDRSLRACLIAKAGRGIVFLDGSDPDDERRFSLAHEVAHFILDYHEPRERALKLLGAAGPEVLEGRRPPTTEERLRGILHGVKLGIFTHLMERSPDGAVNSIDILEAEDRADRLALELLAPQDTVFTRLEQANVMCADPEAFFLTKGILVNEFGLPPAVAKHYGRMLVVQRRSTSSFREWIGA